MTVTLDSKVPPGPIEEKWDHHRFNIRLVNPANRRKYDVIVVGGGHADHQEPGRDPPGIRLRGRGGGNRRRGCRQPVAPVMSVFRQRDVRFRFHRQGHILGAGRGGNSNWTGPEVEEPMRIVVVDPRELGSNGVMGQSVLEAVSSARVISVHDVEAAVENAVRT